MNQFRFKAIVSKRPHCSYYLPPLPFFGRHYSTATAQMVQRVYARLCCAQMLSFSGPSCTTISWFVSGTNYTILSQSNYSITVQWNSAQSNAYVRANYSGCSGGVSSGSAYSVGFNVTSPIIPTVTITSSANGVCTGTGITFFSSVNTTGSTSYQWKINGVNAPGASTSANYFTQALTNGQTVTCVASNSYCTTVGSVVSNGILMTINTGSPVSITIAPSTLPWCDGLGSFTTAVTNEGTNPVYTWYKNDVIATDNRTDVPAGVYAPQNGVSEGTIVKCVLSSNHLRSDNLNINVFSVTTKVPLPPLATIPVFIRNLYRGTLLFGIGRPAGLSSALIAGTLGRAAGPIMHLFFEP